MKEPFAYIDPGTGGLVIGSLWSIISAALLIIVTFLITYFVRPLKRFLSVAWNNSRIFFKNHPVMFSLATVLVIVAGLVILLPGQNIINGAFLSGERMTKVLLIGIDAMDPKVVDKLMSEGKLPNFEKLSYSSLETTIPPETPVAWSAAATGSNPGKYGIYDFISRNPETYLPKLSLTEQDSSFTGTKYKSAMKGIPFWRITSDNGIPTTVLRWPLTFPPEKINGRMLSGLGVVDIRGFLNSYSFYTSGDVEKNPDDTGKLIKVSKNNNEIMTSVYGPMVRKGDELADSETPLKIRLHDDRATIHVDGSEYEVNVNEWSDWIRVKFRVDFLREVSGIFRAYLLSTEPEFAMYITSVQIDPENPVIDVTYPRGYGRDLTQEIGMFYTMGIPEDTKAVTEGRISKEVFLEQIKHIESEREQMFWYEFERFDSGIYAFGFDAGDRFQHIFWDSAIPKELEGYYTDKDRFLGEVLEKLNDDTHLIVFSDHGFSNFERAVSINTWLVENGYLKLTQKPTEDDPGNLFKYVDWNGTRAYSLGFVSLFINLKGREGNGIVQENEKETLINEIIEKLIDLRDPKYNKRAITNLYRSSEIYSGEHTENAPDVIIGFEPGYRMSWQNAIGGASPEVIFNNDEEWKGDHLMDRSHVPGVIFANFEISKQNPGLMDIAPTILSLLGLEIPESMDGEALHG